MEQKLGGSCFGRSTGGFPVGSGHPSSLPSLSASLWLRPWHHVCRTRFAFGFGYSARPALSGKPHLTGCGIIGLRYVVKAGSNGPSGNPRPMLPNNSFKPTWLSPRGLIQALGSSGLIIGLFLFRTARCLFAGRLRLQVFAATAFGRFPASASASGFPHSLSFRLRARPAAGFSGKLHPAVVASSAFVTVGAD